MYVDVTAYTFLNKKTWMFHRTKSVESIALWLSALERGRTQLKKYLMRNIYLVAVTSCKLITFLPRAIQILHK